MILNIFLNMFR